MRTDGTVVSVTVTVSIGSAIGPTEELDALLGAAHQNLLQARRRTRDRFGVV